jgi:hypothetical protein
MRLRLDWEPFLRAFLEQFDQRVATLQSRSMVTDVSLSEVVLVQSGPRQAPIVRSVRTTGGYELKVRVFTGQVDFGRLISSTWVELFGTRGGATDRHFMKIDFNIDHVSWEFDVGSSDRRMGGLVISKDSQAEEYRLAIRDGLNFAFEYAMLVTTK